MVIPVAAELLCVRLPERTFQEADLDRHCDGNLPPERKIATAAVSFAFRSSTSGHVSLGLPRPRGVRVPHNSASLPHLQKTGV